SGTPTGATPVTGTEDGWTPMRRDDLRRSFLSPEGVCDFLFVFDAEALDAIGRKAALKHWLTEECEMCEWSGLDQTGHGDQPPCGFCDGRGWKAKKRVWVGSYSDDEPIVIFPAKWLEGDDE